MDELKKTVFENRPALQKILEQHGSQSLKNYLANNANDVFVAVDRKRQLLAEFKKSVEEYFGADVAASAEAQLGSEYFVSTADHHGPIFHPFFLNGNLLRGLANKQKGFRNIIVLSCANVSLNNSSFPRGLLYTENHLQKHLPIFSLKDKHSPVHSQRAYTQQDIDALTERAQQISPELADTISKVYSGEEILSSQNYSEQVSKTNFELWKLMPLQQGLNLIYLSQEDLVSRLIVKHHLSSETEINKLIFDKQWHELYAKRFEDIAGAFSQDKGTFLFWRVQDGKRERINKEDLQFNAGSLGEQLLSGELMPSMALSFIVLSFYYGLKCGGGFSQVDYLGKMKEAYAGLLSAARMDRPIDVQTNYFSGEFGLDLGAAYQMTTIDLLLADQQSVVEKLKDNYDKMTLGQSLDLMMPEFYKIITGKLYG